MRNDLLRARCFDRGIKLDTGRLSIQISVKNIFLHGSVVVKRLLKQHRDHSSQISDSDLLDRGIKLDTGRLSIQISVKNIFLHGSVVVKRLLKQHRDHSSQISDSDLLQVVAIYLNASGIRVVKATEQLEQRSLARAVWTNNRDDLSLRNRHRKIVERLATRVRITERHAVELNPNFDLRHLAVLTIHYHRLQREKLKQIPEKQTVPVKLARVLQQRAHQSLTLIERRINQRQLTQRHETVQRFPHHPSERRTNDQQRDQAGCQFSETLTTRQMQTLAA